MPRHLLAAALLLAAAGCGPGSTGSVSGTVTLDGRPLEKGYVSFTPEDERGGTAGGEVEAGRYRVAGLRPGKYWVQVSGRPAGPVVEPGSEAARRTLTDAEVRALTDPLLPGVTGARQAVEVRAGAQTCDFRLESGRGGP